ncbi:MULTISPECIES: DUF1285 domain-containing protein [Pseudovibrio]|uniref:DUF1285 domain-containing protein n=1 Tax=Stappiaceae TaxID=2821832 RepID=UPI002365B277|nr:MULTISPECIES: DUF1285 domain-containing protein [Pseudovibrio]MDD7910162.1 DUF1285 domain-containing protein [Pseudovibrio exalbescens]MDX5595352.1 DUF1285 domain-containing protein [Pseudovibrio sp. SPO723]
MSELKMPAGLQALIDRAGGADKSLPPIDKWDPPFCGDLDMRIASDGQWYYMGTPITRQALVNLFASVLKRDDDGKYYLVTPVEKIGLTVDDAPFLAVEMDYQPGEDGEGPLFTFRTNTGDVIAAGPEHPMRFENEEATGGLKPYIHVRGKLEALLARPLLYELADHMIEHDVDGGSVLGIESNGAFFPAERLEDK